MTCVANKVNMVRINLIRSESTLLMHSVTNEDWCTCGRSLTHAGFSVLMAACANEDLFCSKSLYRCDFCSSFLMAVRDLGLDGRHSIFQMRGDVS